MADTKSILEPPSQPLSIALGFAGDEIEALAILVVSLKLADAQKLVEYLKQRSTSSDRQPPG